MKNLLIFLLSMGLTACFSFNAKQQTVQPNEVPLAHAYTDQAHPLGKGEYPSKQRDAYALLLIGQASQDQPARAQQACRALFNNADSTLRGVAQSKVSTYLPVNKSGDFTRVSTRFKWGMCSRLNELADIDREERLLEQIGYGQTPGPVLVAIDQAFTKQQTAAPLPAIVADLSMVPAHEIAVVVQNWLSAVHAGRWNQQSDLGDLADRLHEGLESRRVAISRMPEGSGKEIALR